MSLGNDVFVLRVYPKYDVYADQTGVIYSPADKRPVGSVPQATDKENDERIADDFPFRAFVSAEGKVDIISEPCHQ